MKFKITFIQTVILFLIVLIGVLYVTGTSIYMENAKRAQVMQIARSIEVTLPKADILALESDSTEINQSIRQSIISTLKSVAQVNPNSGVVYIYKLRNGTLHVIADSESKDALNNTAPGQEYVESDKSYYLPFKNGKVIVTDPVRDSWGKWISVLVPIKDESTGNVIAVFGMDFDSKSWKYSHAFEVIESGLVMFLLLLVLYFLFKIKFKNNLLKADIGKLKKAGQVLHESELKLITTNLELKEKNTFIQTVLDNLPIGLSLNNIHDGKFSYMNNKFEEIYGWKSDEIPSVTAFFDKIFPDEKYRKKIRDRVMFDINSGDPEKMHWEKILVTHKDSSKRVINVVNIPLVDQKTMVSTVLDFTKLYKTQKKLIKAKEKAEESDRLKSAFLANMSHEIRTPMNGILGFAGLLREPHLTGEEQQEYIGIIEKSGTRMLNIINDIVSLSKVEAGQMEVSISDTNLNDQVDYIHKFFKPEADQIGILLIVKKSLLGTEAIIRTDREKVYAILTNLVKNALKFTSEGAIVFGYEKKDDYIEFFVKDTGLGVRNEQKNFIFERFRQGNESYNRNYEGAGLGLSISKAYVEMLGGRIWVESEEGKGSEFHFTLPYNPVSPGQLIPENVITSKVVLNQIKDLKILIVEDDKTTALLLSTIVKKFGKVILKAVTGVEAIEACRVNPDIDLILMDIKMPVMDGYEATRQIRRFNKEVIIIAQSAFALSGDAARAINAGCNDYMAKPFSLGLFTDLIIKYFQESDN